MLNGCINDENETAFTRLIGISMNYHISTLKALRFAKFSIKYFIFIYSGNGSRMSEYSGEMENRKNH